MEGEEEESTDPRAFCRKKVWQRLIILVAGSVMNFLLGFLLMVVLFSGANGFNSPVLAGFQEGCPYQDVLQVGDEIYKVNGERVYYTANFSEYVTKDSADGYIDLTILRNGKKIELKDYHMVPVEYPTEDGGVKRSYGLFFAIEEANFFNRLEYSWYTCLDFVRMVRQSLVMLFSGSVGLSEMTGVVGMVDMINETGQSAETTKEGIEDILYLVAFIAVNLAVMNMLPIPAVDGGHVVTLLLTWGIEKIIGRKIDSKYEGYIHYVGLLLLLALMVLIMFNDVIRIIRV
jgi:regulator of sigma E protease